MKKISIVIPTYNEVENVRAIADAVTAEMSVLAYKYEILFIDNCSSDGTRGIIESMCTENADIKAIFNVKNFGQFNSPVYGMLQSEGDCTILLAADFQDPVDMIPKFIAAWEEGYTIVCGIKTSSGENPIIYNLRSVYYKLIKRFSSTEQIEHFTGFGLYDKSFIETLRNLHDPAPFLRGIVAELGGKRKDIEYKQPQRRFGKTHNNFYSLYDAAMLAFTSYTKIGLRIATFIGFIIAAIAAGVGIAYLIMKLVYWDRFAAGTMPLLIGMYFLGAVQLVFIGFLGEYILNINTRLMNRPLVIEEKRLNFKESSHE
ncbi:MAG: glycosyltransferase family 2 protein [Clostridia bacterium]|nr:glycosyltransferase family 2 protein [Clostridia bacterium]